MGYSVVRLLAFVMLMVAMGRCPPDYYTLLRVMVCAAGAYGAIVSYKANKVGWAWCMGVAALLFNPILPIHLDRGARQLVDATAGAFFFVSLFFVQPTAERAKMARSVGWHLLLWASVAAIIGSSAIFIAVSAGWVAR